MAIEEIKADGLYLKYVECFWECCEHSRHIIYPDGTLNIVYSSGPCKVFDGIRKIDLPAGVFILPGYTNSVFLYAEKPMFGIRIKAFSMFNLALFTRQNHARIQVFEHEILHFEPNRFFLKTYTESEAVSLQDNLEFLKEIVALVCIESGSLNNDVRNKLNFILERKGLVEISEMEKEFGVSRQSIHKLFTTHTGFSPKAIADVWRSNYMLQLMANKYEALDAILSAGYYDQSHGIKAFKKSFGQTPSKFTSSDKSAYRYFIDCVAKRFGNYYDPVV